MVHTNSHLDDEAGASVKFATTVFVGFLWKKNPKKTHISWLAFRRARERGIRSYTSSSLFMVPRFFFFFCANGVRISTDIYSFGFIWAFRIDRWRHPLLPSRPLPSCSLSSAHTAYLWYVSVQCANCILDTHPSGSANVCVYIYCIFVCTVCNIIRFKALKARCCIMNALFGVCVCTLCFLFACVFVFVYIYVYVP